MASFCLASVALPLRSLTIVHLKGLYADLRRCGRNDGAPLAPKKVLNVHQILRTALGDAERQGLVARNLARLMDPPCHGIAPEQLCCNAHQLSDFLDVARGHRLGTPLWLAAMTGMRRGEVLGLRWGDSMSPAPARLSAIGDLHRLSGPHDSDQDPHVTALGRSRRTNHRRAQMLARGLRSGRSAASMTPWWCSPPPTVSRFIRTCCRRRLIGCRPQPTYRGSACTIYAVRTRH